uniref:Uncharacterized protein n=1 Tax=Cannabis sativa TaxID=3483 RepID=A0A803PXR8_CANSA
MVVPTVISHDLDDILFIGVPAPLQFLVTSEPNLLFNQYGSAKINPYYLGFDLQCLKAFLVLFLTSSFLSLFRKHLSKSFPPHLELDCFNLKVSSCMFIRVLNRSPTVRIRSQFGHHHSVDDLSLNMQDHLAFGCPRSSYSRSYPPGGQENSSENSKKAIGRRF